LLLLNSPLSPLLGLAAPVGQHARLLLLGFQGSGLTGLLLQSENPARIGCQVRPRSASGHPRRGRSSTSPSQSSARCPYGRARCAYNAEGADPHGNCRFHILTDNPAYRLPLALFFVRREVARHRLTAADSCTEPRYISA